MDLARGRVTFWATKNGKPRSVPLTRRAEGALEGHLPARCLVTASGPTAVAGIRICSARPRAALVWLRTRLCRSHHPAHLCQQEAGANDLED